MQRILSHCLLERRRIVFAGLMAFIAGFVLYSHIGGKVYGIPVPLYTGLFYMVAVAIGAAVTTFIFPRLRRLVDGIAFVRVGLSFWVVATQSYWFVTSPLISAIIVVVSAVLLLAIGRQIARLSQQDNRSQWLAIFVEMVGSFFHWLDNIGEYAEALRAGTVKDRAAPATS